VFGAIVRISGSGWDAETIGRSVSAIGSAAQPARLIVEVSHRYLASILFITVSSMVLVAFRHRDEVGIGGSGGVLRSAVGSLIAVLSAAVLGGVTVKMGNAPWATVAHQLVAMTLLALVATTAIRAGALGGSGSLRSMGPRARRDRARVAAVLAIIAVALGGSTAFRGRRRVHDRPDMRREPNVDASPCICR
jgi:heme A synthase